MLCLVFGFYFWIIRTERTVIHMSLMPMGNNGQVLSARDAAIQMAFGDVRRSAEDVKLGMSVVARIAGTTAQDMRESLTSASVSDAKVIRQLKDLNVGDEQVKRALDNMSAADAAVVKMINRVADLI